MRHPDLLRDPLGTVERLYGELGLPLGDEARRRMGRFVEEEARKPTSVHEHRPEGFGLREEEIRERFRPLIERFDL